MVSFCSKKSFRGLLLNLINNLNCTATQIVNFRHLFLVFWIHVECIYTYEIFSKLFYSVFVREVSIIRPIYASAPVYREPTLYECFHFNDDVPVIFHEIRIARFSL